MVSEDEKVSIQKKTFIHNTNLDVSCKAGVKRSRTWSDEKQPTVHVTYKHLTRASKQKLESLLQQWSEWNAENTSLAHVSFVFGEDRAGPVSHGASFQLHVGGRHQSYRSSQIHEYSSQYSEAQNLDENSREARRRWTPPEDILLISAWLNTSKDPIIGNQKKAHAFWERIAAYYAASPVVAGKPTRGAGQCKERWRKINESVNKFVGCYSQASRRRSSGQSEDDVLKMAYQFYSNDHKGKFTLEHCCLELRHDQKWCTLNTNESSKRTKLDASGKYSSSSNRTSHAGEEGCSRPPGVKSSKGKEKKSESNEASSLLKFEGLWEIKQKDIAATEMLSRERLLNSLICKPELSESEIKLKEKLIAENLRLFDN